MKKAIFCLVTAMFAACLAAPVAAVEQKPPEGAEYETIGNSARYADQDLVLAAEYLDPAHADLYFTLLRGGRFANPFPPGSFIVFSLEIKNKGRKKVSFDPRMTMLYVKKEAPLGALDYTMFYAYVELAGADDVEGRMEAYKASCYDGAVTLLPGEKAQRLLVFKRGREEPKGSAGLLLEGIYLDHAPHTARLAFGELF